MDINICEKCIGLMNDYAKSYLNSDDKYIWVVIGGDKGLCQIAWKNPYGT